MLELLTVIADAGGGSGSGGPATADPASILSNLYTAAPWLVGPTVALGVSWKWWLGDAFEKFVAYRKGVRESRLAEKRADREAKALARDAEFAADAATAKALHDSRAAELDLQRRIVEANTALSGNLERGLAASNALNAALGTQAVKLEGLVERLAKV